MLINVVVLLAFSFGIVGLFAFIAITKLKSVNSNNTNPQFNLFQKSYFVALFPSLFADWLNAPYLYKLFSHYGFVEQQIVIIYICGMVSALICGTFSIVVIQKLGSIKTSVIFSSIYALGCILKLSQDYSTLIISRILCGMSTALLFSAHETWYNEGHFNIHEFPKEWSEETGSVTSFSSNILAITAGIVAYLVTELIGYGPVAPSLIAVPFLIISAYIVWTQWSATKAQTFEHDLPTSVNVVPEQTQIKKARFSKMFLEGVRNIAQNPDLLNIGCVQALYESVLCIFVFLWTPVLDHHGPPLGIVFASFMTASMCGDILYKLYLKNHAITLTGSLLFACVGILSCVLSTSHMNEFPIVSYTSFLLVEFSMGLYFPAMSSAKKQIKPELQNVAVTSIFRIPLTLIACWGLMMLHHSSKANGTRHLFVFCLIMVSCAAGLSVKTFRDLTKKNTTTG